MMYRKVMIIGLVLAGALLTATCLAKQPTVTCRAHGQATLKALTHGQYDRVDRFLAPDIAAKITAEQWQQIWKHTTAQSGTFRKLGKLVPRKLFGYELLVARIDFSKVAKAALVGCDSKNRITTFRLMPASRVSAMLNATPAPMPPGATSADIKVPTPLGPLPGKLVLPAGKGPFPAVVLVQGSGSTNYDETVGPNKPFRDIAMGLAKLDVATLRYDKRSFVYGKEMEGKSITVDDNVTDDALTALHLVAKQKRINPHRVFVLGHSLGAAMAPRIGKRDPQLAGIIMLAAPARPLLTSLAWQFREMGKRQGATASQIAAQEKTVAAERKLLDTANPARPPRGTYLHAPQSFWLSLHDYHQVAVAKTLALPILILQGENDINVSYTKDFPIWEKALAGHANVTFHAYPGFDHLFMKVSKGTLNPDLVPGHVSSKVIHDIAVWIKAQPLSGQ